MRKKDLLQIVEYLPHSALDIRRRERTGIIEAVYAEHKDKDVLLDIAKALIKRNAPLFFTRVDTKKADFLIKNIDGLIYSPAARICYIPQKNRKKKVGFISVVSAGSSDRFYMEEVCLTLDYLGNRFTRIPDVGISGIHRLLPYIKVLKRSSVVVVIAGMEGALPSLIGGLVNAPIIAVPSPVGYGISSGGFAALAGMLSSCSPNVAVVNIGNGFGAACVASLINHKRGR